MTNNNRYKNRFFYLERKELEEVYGKIFSYPLTVIAAPTGYGKSVSLKSFLDRKEVDYFWIKLNEGHRNCQHFWKAIIESAAEKNKSLADELNAIGFPFNSIKLSHVADVFLDAPAFERCVLVLDGYHVAENANIDWLIENAVTNYDYIENIHLVILCNKLPDIKLTELLVKDIVYLIDSTYLRFTCEDIKRYFHLRGYDLEENDAREILDLSGGWAAAIYIIYLGMQKGIKPRHVSGIQELLRTSVYDCYDEKTKVALCKLSALDEFTMELAEDVLGEIGASEIIERVSKENSFVEYEKDSNMFRINNVFRELLKKEAAMGGVDTKDTCRRAGFWFLKQMNHIEAYRYLFRGEAYDTLYEELEKPNKYICMTDRQAIIRFLNLIPQEILVKYPIAFLKIILFCFIIEDKKKASELLAKFEENFADYECSQSEKLKIDGEKHVIKMIMKYNDAEAMLKEMDCAIEKLQGSISALVTTNRCWSLGSPHFLYNYYNAPGSMKRLVSLPFERYSLLTDGGCLGAEELCKAEYFLEIGRFDEVEEYAQKAIYKARTKKQLSITICAAMTLCRLYLLKDKYTEALKILDEIKDEALQDTENLNLNSLDLCIGYFFACAGEQQKIPRWIKNGNLETKHLTPYGLSFSYIVLGKALILSEDWLKAEALCETFTRCFEEFNNQLGHIHNYIHLSIAAYMGGDIVKATERLNCALEIGQQDHIVMPFVENSFRLLPIIKNLSSCDSAYVKEIIKKSTAYAKVIAELEDHGNTLSQREIEVLRLKAEGLSRREIAGVLCISEGTVRTHIQNIHRKLDVNKRSAVLEKAKELKLL